MSVNKLVNYTGVGIWLVFIIFTMGGLFVQITANTSRIQALDALEVAQAQHEAKLALVQLQLVHQKRWQTEFGETLKELVEELKQNNSQMLDKIQSTKNIVRLNTYKLQTISNEIHNSNKYVEPEEPK